MITAIYARVSTDEQARTGYSLNDQVLSCRQRLLAQGQANIEEYVDDGYSGEFLDRPALARLRNDIRDKLIKAVMVYDPDRLSRNLTNQLIIADEIERYGVKLDFITGSYDASPEGRLFFSMRGAIAEFEKEKIRERSLRGKRAKVLSGKPLFSKEPFGYNCDRKLNQYIINEDEAQIVRTIFNLYTEKRLSVASVEEELKAMGIVNRSGNPFHRSVLYNMIKNELYAGTKWSFQRYLKAVGQKKRKSIKRDTVEWVAVSVPAIIDKETFEKATRLRGNNKIVAKRNTKAQYLLQGIIKCAKCGYAMGGVMFPDKRNKGGAAQEGYKYYVCKAYTNGIACDNRKCVPVNILDDNVWADLENIFRKSGGIKSSNENIDFAKRKSAAETKLTKLKKRQAAIIKWVANGTIEPDAAEKELQKLNDDIKETQLIILDYENPAPKSGVTTQEVYEATTFEQKRNIISKLNITIGALREKTGEISYTIRV